MKAKNLGLAALMIALAILVCPVKTYAEEGDTIDTKWTEGLSEIGEGSGFELNNMAREEGGQVAFFVIVPEEYDGSLPFSLYVDWYGTPPDGWIREFQYKINTINVQFRMNDLEKKYGLDQKGLHLYRFEFTTPPGEYQFSNERSKEHCPKGAVAWDHVIVLTNKLGLPFVEDGYHISLPDSGYPNAEADTVEENLTVFPAGEKTFHNLYGIVVFNEDDYYNEDRYEALVSFAQAFEEANGRLLQAEGDAESIDVEGESKPEEIKEAVQEAPKYEAEAVHAEEPEPELQAKDVTEQTEDEPSVVEKEEPRELRAPLNVGVFLVVFLAIGGLVVVLLKSRRK